MCPRTAPQGSRIWGLSVCLLTWLTFLLGDLDCVFDLLGHLARMFSLHRNLEDFGMLHFHWVHGWMDMCVRILFTGSLLGSCLEILSNCSPALSVIALSTPLPSKICEVVHHGRQLGVHIRVTLLTCAELCSQLQLCSTARSLHSDPLAGSLASSPRSALAVLRQSSAPAGWSSRARETPSASCRALPGVVVTCSATMFVGRPVSCLV